MEVLSRRTPTEPDRSFRVIAWLTLAAVPLQLFIRVSNLPESHLRLIEKSAAESQTFLRK